MGKKQESAKLILELFDLRREAKLREARDWIFKFHPKNIDDVNATLASHDGVKLRMVTGYWDMAAALVNHGAIDRQMFMDTNGEYMFVFAKIQPFLPDMRKSQPDLMMQLEKLIMKMPNANKQMEQFRQMMVHWGKTEH